LIDRSFHIKAFKTFFAGCLASAMLSACNEKPMVEVDVAFDGGSGSDIIIDSPDHILFTLSGDPGDDEKLWFHLRVTASSPIQPEFTIRNSGQAHQHNWDVVQPLISVDGHHWIRAIDTNEGPGLHFLERLIDKLTGRPAGFRFRSPVSAREFQVAYSWPYTERDLQNFLRSIADDERVTVGQIGESTESRPIPILAIDQPSSFAAPDRDEIWVIAREHPGETPASLVLEGLVTALLEPMPGKQLLNRYRFRIVPMLNIDGVANGLYYRNPNGVDLSQDWEHFRAAETQALHDAMRSSLKQGRVALVVNLHSANAPKSHFFLETPANRLDKKLATLQQSLFESAAGTHRQLQIKETVELWDYPAILGNFLSQQFNVYCLYLESNYSTGADGSTVTPASLRALGAAVSQTLDTVLIENQLSVSEKTD
jgi:hypothetical protein